MYHYIKRSFKTNLNKNIIIIAITGLSIALVMGILILHGSMSKRISWLMEDYEAETSITVFSEGKLATEEINKILDIDYVRDLDMQLEYNAEGKIGENPRSLWLLGCSQKSLDVDNAIIIEGRVIDFNSDKYEILVDNKVAKQENIKIGDEIVATLQGKQKTFNVVGIYKRDRFLMQASYEFYVGARILQDELKVSNQFNKINIITENKNYQTVLRVKEEIDKEYFNLFTYQTIFDNKETAKNELSSFSMALWSILSIFLLGSIYLIYNSFYIRLHEKTKVLAMFKTLGANDKQIKSTFIGEGILVGALGSLIGIIVGTLVGVGFSYVYTGKDLGEVRRFFTIRPSYFLISILIGMLTSYIGSYIPIKKVVKLSPISAMKNSTSQAYIHISMKKQFIKFILGIIFLVAILFSTKALIYISGDALIYLSMVVLGLISVCSILLVLPYVINRISRIIIFLSKRYKKFELLLAGENVMNNRNNTYTMVSIIVVGLMVIISLNGMFSSARGSVKEYVDLMFDHDYMILSDDREYSDHEIKEKMEQINKSGILKDYTIVNVYNYIDEATQENYRIFAVDPKAFDNYTKLKLTKDDKYLTFNNLDDNNCFVSKQIMIESKYKQGSILELGNNLTNMQFTIEASFETFTNDGRLIFVNKNKLKDRFDLSITSKMIQTNKKENISDEDFVKVARDVFSDDKYTIMNIEDFGDGWRDDIVKGIEIFEIMFILISCFLIFSLINNYITSIWTRKEEVTMLSVLGARDYSIGKMISYETIIISFITLVLGVIGSNITLFIFIKSLAGIFNTDLHLYYPYNIAVTFFILLFITFALSCFYILKKIFAINKNEIINEKNI